MPPMPTIAEWHILLSGFMQRQGDVNGMVHIWDELRRVVESPSVVVQLHSWNCNLADIAELIKKLTPLDAPPRINLYGYSWGGQSCVNLARELRRRGLQVDHMVLSDAVYRHWYPFGWWRAFAPWRSIRVPDNVRRVTHFRQQQSLPMGHRVIAENPGLTTIDPVTWLRVDHCWMDDASQFRAACLDAAKGFLSDEASPSEDRRIDQADCLVLRAGDVIVDPESRSDSPTG